jgi:hypothetical protein
MYINARKVSVHVYICMRVLGYRFLPSFLQVYVSIFGIVTISVVFFSILITKSNLCQVKCPQAGVLMRSCVTIGKLKHF